MENKCANCKPKEEQVKKKYEREMYVSALERSNRRMFIALIITLALLFLTNLAWIIRENQFEDVKTEEVSIEAEQETSDGGNNYVVGGDMLGEAESQSNGQENDDSAT